MCYVMVTTLVDGRGRVLFFSLSFCERVIKAVQFCVTAIS